MLRVRLHLRRGLVSSWRDSSLRRLKSSSILGLESNVASKEFKNRWLMVLPAFATHMCLGAPYAWSLMADQITRELGFVTPAMADWSLMEAALPLSIVFIAQGIAASAVGKWQLKVGPRAAMATASVCFGGGFMLGALGIHIHSLPLLYAGYGLLGGTGIGLAYTPPVQTLMQWFPDKKGIASGLTIAGFGSGALLFAPLVQHLMKMFTKMPQYLGPLGSVPTTAVDGKLFAQVNDTMVEVVIASQAEIAKLPYALSEGLYVVGSGNTGAAEALGVIGAGYFVVMLLSALTFYKPHPSFTPSGLPISTETQGNTDSGPDVNVDAAMRSSQFYLLGTTFFCVGAGGMGLFSVAKTMMSEVFSVALPTVVTASFTGAYVLILSAGNLGGRLGWSAISDAIGRRNTFYIFTFCSVPLYLSVPKLVDMAVNTGASAPLYVFCVSTAVAVSIFGGIYAVLPAYEADLFGAKNVGPIHGRMLLFSSTAALAGPYLLLKLRSMSEKAALDSLMHKVGLLLEIVQQL